MLLQCNILPAIPGRCEVKYIRGSPGSRTGQLIKIITALTYTAKRTWTMRHLSLNDWKVDLSLVVGTRPKLYSMGIQLLSRGSFICWRIIVLSLRRPCVFYVIIYFFFPYHWHISYTLDETYDSLHNVCSVREYLIVNAILYSNSLPARSL